MIYTLYQWIIIFFYRIITSWNMVNDYMWILVVYIYQGLAITIAHRSSETGPIKHTPVLLSPQHIHIRRFIKWFISVNCVIWGCLVLVGYYPKDVGEGTSLTIVLEYSILILHYCCYIYVCRNISFLNIAFSNSLISVVLCKCTSLEMTK